MGGAKELRFCGSPPPERRAAIDQQAPPSAPAVTIPPRCRPRTRTALQTEVAQASVACTWLWSSVTCIWLGQGSCEGKCGRRAVVGVTCMHVLT